MKAFISIFLFLITSLAYGQKDTITASIYQNGSLVKIKHVLSPFNFNILKEYSSSIIPIENVTNNLFSRIKPGPFLVESGSEPEMYFIIKNDRIPYKPGKSPKINPKWIRKIETITNRGEPSNHGNRHGIILIYPKKRYYEQVKQIFLNN